MLFLQKGAWLPAIAIVLFITACQATIPARHRSMDKHFPPNAGSVSTTEYISPKVLDLKLLQSLDDIIPRLRGKQVVFIGENHDRWDHHQNQLEIIRRLHRGNTALAIGMEFFQQPFQAHLDDYVAGEIGDRELLRRTEYYERWSYDYRFYQPILEFARNNRIPVVALNVPQEIARKVGDKGLAALSEEERARIPKDIDRSDKKYLERLRAIFAMHAKGDVSDFNRFVDVQLLWDEGMAERVVGYLNDHPERTMIVLAGSGHLVYGAGIPNRVNRRLPVDAATVINSGPRAIKSGMADFLLLPEERRLPPAGKLGIFMETGTDGVKVNEFATASAGQAAGMQKGDYFITLNGEKIARFGDVKSALWDRKPGDTVTVRVRRGHWLLGDKELVFKVTLR